MASHNLHTWTIGCLIGAFFDLAVAYLLLCVSASLFIPLKCLTLFDIYLPCSCDDGHTSHNLCLYKLLFDWPVRSIYSVRNSAINSFPFNLIQLNDEFAESESRLQSFVDKQNGYDTKGKKIMNNQKQRGLIRRRKKTQSGYGRLSTVLLDKSRKHSMTGVSGSSSIDFELSESSGRLDPVSIIEEGPQDDGSATEGLHPSERTRHVFEIDEENKFSSNGQEKTEIFGTDMKMLSQALDDEKALCISLFMELEKERAAAATAADEAMAMIIRLQEEKASIEMELRQYQRMIEEKSAYDEEEVNVLKEILVRREKEKHLLEKEVEAYRHMEEELSQNEQSDDDGVINQPSERTFVLAGIKDENSNDEEEKIIKTEPVYNGISDTETTIYDVHVINEINNGSSTSQKKDVISNSSIDGNENFKLENEVEWLRERLSMMQQEKEKLTLSAERREKMNAQLQGLMNQLLEIKELGEPEWHAS